MMKGLTLASAVVLLVASAAFAQAPRITNAAVQERAVAGPFDAFFRGLVQQQVKPAWIAYSVASVRGHRAGCWGGGQSSDTTGTYYLEGRPFTVGGDDRTVKLEGDATVLVLFRVENREVGRLAVFSPECEMDGGGLPFFVLNGVAPADSARLLTTFARATTGRDRIARTAVTALALHADPAADAALEQLVAANQPIEIRKQAALWLGVARGERGYDVLRQAVDRDPDADFRRQAAMALAQSPAPGAIDTLMHMAKADADPSVRGQALFWVAQKAGKKAAGAITDAIVNDPETQVKERAVFALSRLPKDEGIPLLIDVARSNRNPRVRERAMFWLGQSKDPRAVAFFEEVLKGR